MGNTIKSTFYIQVWNEIEERAYKAHIENNHEEFNKELNKQIDLERKISERDNLDLEAVKTELKAQSKYE
jgi:hypothetical protein